MTESEIANHHNPRVRAARDPANILRRLLLYVSIDAASGCWLWVGATRGTGYGAFGIGRRQFQAHRVAYELLVGPIPQGLQIDHLCRVRRCVNPAHLEPVTQRENLLRGNTIVAAQAAQTHCKRGHLFDEANTRVRNGQRLCRACSLMHATEFYRANREAILLRRRARWKARSA